MMATVAVAEFKTAPVPKKVAAVGLSRNGKIALVAGAFDTRFAMTVSCCSRVEASVRNPWAYRARFSEGGCAAQRRQSGVSSS